MRLLRCADSGLLVELDELAGVLALYNALADRPPPGVTDLVPAARTLLLRLDPQQADITEVERAVRSAPTGQGTLADRGQVTVPVRYDGADLAEVARLTGLSERAVVQAHTATEWTVAFGGFAPGFGYLTGGDGTLHVPRRSESRTRVPAGSVGLAGEFSGIYPQASPGGWQLIGHTDLRIWQVDRDPPALLRPGVRVRFEEVDP
ncbi:KipI family sensor histidine kinase inhibitor [Halopolyspora algeriensis]|uniref:KipI family sensor histidine kinase inhibitor n=1 Tax=Halopolyspora algeriensis TaxID=1500506 RepID=A0A368VV60_9ACTN|nr:allophanate hydrolase subunit 1 [Halopolyspora algeriensis]RCW45733.1 KipI family sensor histidine kinase inhibitor [Halopolyspora algeriensis]TQM54117.1 KipI family sensor histidine kinase inhibitor [Halopolyspora algeriensis]